MRRLAAISAVATLVVLTGAACTPPHRSTPAPTIRAVRVSTGVIHTCAVLTDATVRCWGGNDYGQLGDGTVTAHNTPVAVVGLDHVSSVSAGNNNTCAARTDGTVVCWGSNNAEKSGQPYFQEPHQPAAVAITNTLQLSVGSAHVCAVVTTGAVACWGSGSRGTLGVTKEALIAEDGTDYRRVPRFPGGLTTATQVASGDDFSCARLSSGSVKCWGANEFGQLGNGSNTDTTVPTDVSGITTAVDVSAGAYHACARLADDTVRCWGYGDPGSLGHGDRLDSWVPVTVLGLTGATGIAVGNQTSCSRQADGTAKCWGGNSSEVLGEGGPTPLSTSPVAITGLAGVTDLDIGGSHACAVVANVGIRCWGDGFNGQLGDGNKTTSTPTPVTVVGISP